MRQALALNPLSSGRRNALRAVRLLEQGAESEPDDPIYPYWCGVIYRTFGIWDKAVDYFRRALELEPDHGPSRLELAWAHMHARDFDAARAVLSGITSASRGAAAGSGGAPALDNDWRLHRLHAILFLDEGRPLDAFDVYPSSPPEEVHVRQWWQEYLLVAEAAGEQAPATVLQRLEARRAELEMLLGANERPGPHAEELHHLWAVMGRLAAAAGDTTKADEYRGLVPRSSDAYRLVRDVWLRMTDEKAHRALEQGDLETAVALWQEALEEDSDNAQRRGWLVYALCRLAADKWEHGDAEGAVALWDMARRFDVSSSELLHNLAIGYERLERWAEANRCREAYLKSFGETVYDQTDGDAQRAALLVAMAENAWRAGQMQETRRLLDAAASDTTNDVHLLTRAALLYAALGDAEKSLATAMAALALEPGFEPAINCILHVSHLPGFSNARTLNAMAQALHGLPSDNRYVRDWRRRTLAYGRRALEANAADEAMEAFASLLLADPGDIEAWLWAGAAHMKRGNRSGAEDCFTEAIRLDPSRAATYIDLGARFLAEGDRPRAEQYFEQAVQAAPDPTTHVTIGELCAHIGVPDLAEHHLRAALTGEHDARPILVRAICGLLETGQEERVRPFLEEALNIAPDTVQLKILVAVQHLRHQEWVNADDCLREADRLARERDDRALLEHVAFFRHALILLRTIGQIDERAFQAQIRSLLDQWLAEAVDVELSEDELTLEPVEALLARLPSRADVEPLLPPMPSTAAEPNGEPSSTAVDLTLFFNMHVPPVGRLSTN